MKIIGIDLGTSNTYIYLCEFAPDNASMPQPMPTPLVLPGLGDANGSMATVVMYENGRAVLGGNIAESEFYSNVERQPDRSIASQFKPEIASREPSAMAAMTDFLHVIRENLPEGLLSGEIEIYVGMPSLSREDYKINLTQCFTQAGWPAPRFVRESDAAMISCLQSGALDIDDLEHKCMILDFGGGTCDYTTLEKMEILQNGGDLLYGGRLFDDLFFQVFCRENPDFAKDAPHSPFAWYVHWIECKEQKENFSDYYRQDDHKGGCSLHAVWYDVSGARRDAFIHDYDKNGFIRDAENFTASDELLAILAEYRNRGGLSAVSRDVLEGRVTGLISWLRSILEGIGAKKDMRKIILTGGSARWFFVRGLTEEIFENAQSVASARGYEDIAFGLALFPVLAESHSRVRRLLEEKLPRFSEKASAMAIALAEKETGDIITLCAERMANDDVMPVLEEAAKGGMTIREIETKCAEKIKADTRLNDIIEEKSRKLRENIQLELDLAFKKWLRDNGVLLVPNFQFPAQAIGKDFYDSVSVKITRLDVLSIMQFTITRLLPVLTATVAATAIIHSGEAVSTILGGGLAFGATWLLARTAPDYIENRKLPKFFLNDRNRRKICEKNREFMEEGMRKSLREVETKMAAEIDARLKTALNAMLARISILNQIKTA